MKTPAALLLPALALAAQQPHDTTQGTYEISRAVIAGGSVHASGGTFDVRATAGQPDVDPLQPATGGTFELVGGFWTYADSGPPTDRIFADDFE